MKFFILFIIFYLDSYNIRRRIKYTTRQRKKILAKHNELKKKARGDMYMIENEYGCFSVCLQNHFNYNEVGYASYYDWGHITATGEKFSPNNYTAAHPYLPIPCVAEIKSVSDPNKKIIVKINDRGPFIQNPKVIIDVTKKGAEELGFCYHGLLKVRVKVLIKETMSLVEHGGNISWSGRLPFWLAVKLSKYREKYKKRKGVCYNIDSSKKRI